MSDKLESLVQVVLYYMLRVDQQFCLNDAGGSVNVWFYLDGAGGSGQSRHQNLY